MRYSRPAGRGGSYARAASRRSPLLGGTPLLRRALEEPGPKEPQSDGATQEQRRPATGEALYPTYELVHVVLAQVSGEPLDLIGGVIGVLDNRPLALLSQLLAGLSERRLYGGHPLGGLVLLVRQLGLDLLAAPVRQLSGLLTGLLGELLCLLLRFCVTSLLPVFWGLFSIAILS